MILALFLSGSFKKSKPAVPSKSVANTIEISTNKPPEAYRPIQRQRF